MSSTAQLPMPPQAVPPLETNPGPESRRGPLWTATGIALALLPAAITVYLAFRTGGYYAEGFGGVLVLLAVGFGAAAVAARRPLAGISPPLAIAGAALALLTIWTWFSSEWSDAPNRALVESQRTALYLLAVLFFGSFLRRRNALNIAVAGLGAAILGVCVAALATRLYPDVFTVSGNLSLQRLSFPLTYWNGLGLFAGIGVVLLFHVTSDLRNRLPVRMLAAAAVPVAALTLYFTFSRGALGALAVGLVVYLVVGRSWGIVGSALAIVPATLLALQQAYAADLLGTEDNLTAAAAEQGHKVAAFAVAAAVLAAALRGGLLPLDRRLSRISLAGPTVRRALTIAAAGVALIGAMAAVALDAPERIDRAYDSFTQPEAGGDARTRFRQVTLSGRQEHWNVALDYYRTKPLTGVGAGTYETQWLRSRPGLGETSEAHSLYIEVLSELGIVGLVLLVTALGALLVGLAMRARGTRRPIYGAVFAAMLMWAVHAGVDWDWELPAIGLGLFALAGLALARPSLAAGATARFFSSWPLRIAVALACVLIGVTAVRTVIADSAVDNAVRSFQAGDCESAVADAKTARSAVATNPKAWEVLGWCYVEAGSGREGVTAMAEAARLDPTHWRYRYGLALARGAAGLDPRADMRMARRLNPRAEIVITGAAVLLREARRAQWERLAESATRPGN